MIGWKKAQTESRWRGRGIEKRKIESVGEKTRRIWRRAENNSAYFGVGLTSWRGSHTTWEDVETGPEQSCTRTTTEKEKINIKVCVCLSCLVTVLFFPVYLKWLTHVSYSVSLFCGLTRMLVANKLLSQQTNRRKFCMFVTSFLYSEGYYGVRLKLKA